MTLKAVSTNSHECVLSNLPLQHALRHDADLPRQGADIFGFNVDKQNNITYREWAPNAVEAYLIGDFSMAPPPSRRFYFDD